MRIVRSALRDVGTTLSVLVAAAYVGVSFGVHHLFPFFVFDMYTHVPDVSSRLLGEEADGTVHDVAWYGRWDCPGPVDVMSESAPCSRDGHTSHARDLEASDALRRGATSLPDGPQVTLVRRIVRVDGPDPDSTATDCVIATCRAAR
jgi:hypothetical protein